MVAQMVVVVAGEQGEDEATPQFGEVARNSVAKLADAIRQHGVGTRFALGQTEQAGRRNERHTGVVPTIKTGDDGDALAAHGDEPVFRDLNAGVPGQGAVSYTHLR